MAPAPKDPNADLPTPIDHEKIGLPAEENAEMIDESESQGNAQRATTWAGDSEMGAAQTTINR